MLLEISEIDGFICPKTKKPVKLTNGAVIGVDGISYPIIGGYPLLVDFDRSLLDENSYMEGTVPEVVSRPNYGDVLGFIKSVVFPTSQATSKNVTNLLKLLKERGSFNVLIVGGGSVGQAMDVFYEDRQIKLHSFDIYSSPNVQFVADAHSIPFEDNKFDLVIIQAVLEHVLEPAVVVSEIHRVLNREGIVYAETPFMQHVHEGAYDFTRFTESGHRYLFKEFQLIDSGVVAGAGTQLLWSIDNFFRGLFRSRKVGKCLKLSFFWLVYFDRFISSAYNIDAASGCYFIGSKSDITITNTDVINHYKGAQK